MRIPLPLLILVSLLWCSALNANPITIQLEAEDSRHLLQMRENTQEIELCNLRVGEEYHLRSLGIDGATVFFVQEDGSLSTLLTFTAEEDCQTFLLQKEAGVNSAVSFFLSVDCRSCTSEASAAARANLQVEGGQSALTLIEDVFIGGGCFDVDNATFVGSAAGAGTFTNGDASIGIGSGVILSTGSINDAPGPNDAEGAGGGNGGGSHPDLAILADPNPVFDATGISFEFTPTVAQIAFQYVFASEEYCEYVGSQFNDVFGFFISGPGINGGFTMNGENIAVVPGTNDAITINTINDQQNSGFFVANSNTCGGFFNQQDIQFDGFTSVLSAVANVQPCQKYTIQLLIGDGGDGVFDSAVFLEANSFSAGGASTGEALSPTTNSNITYEACSDGYFVLEAAGDINTDRVINFFVSPQSTATAGVDYIPFGNSVTVPAGQSEVIVPVTVLQDNIIEGQETIVLEFQDPCSCTANFIELIIEDVPPLSAQILPLTICQGDPAQLDALVNGGLPGFSYTWSTGGSGPSIVEYPEQNTSYTVTVTDECGDQVTATTQVNVFPVPQGSMIGGGQYCGDFTAEIDLDFSGTPGPWFFSYTLDGEIQPPVMVEETPFVLEVTEPGFYWPLEVVDVNTGCSGQVQGNAFIEGLEFEVEVVSENISCPGENDGYLQATALNGQTPFNYNFFNLTEGTELPDDETFLEDLPPGEYQVYVQDNQGCVDSTIVEITEPDTLRANGSATGIVTCAEPQGGSIDLQIAGGTPGFSYLWSNGDTIQDPSGLIAGDYEVLVSDANGCLDSTIVTITEDTIPPIADAIVEDTITCSLQEVVLNGTGSTSGDEVEYSWSGPNITAGADGPVAITNQAGEYILEVIDTTNGCTAYDTVSVAADLEEPVALAEPDIVNCYQPEITINTAGSSTGQNFAYEWQGPNLVSGADSLSPVVNGGGEYLLVITNERNDCQDSVSVTIEEDLDIPQVDAGPGGELDCNQPEITLSGSATGNQDDFVYSWTTDEGNFLSGANTLTPTVNSDGMYELLVTDTLNGCTSTASLQITQDDDLPIAIVNGAEPLSCALEQIQLNAENSSLGSDDSFQWFTADGNFVSGTNTLTPVVDQPGDYMLVINEPLAIACQDTAIVTITVDTVAPQLSLPAPQVLTCDRTSFELTANITTQSGQFTAQWNGPNGPIAGSTDSNSITVDAPGNYSLGLTDPVNGCSVAAAITVQQDITPPTAAIANPEVIDCGQAEVTLDASASSAGANFVYQWVGPNADTLSASGNTLQALSTPGVYTLNIENTDNGCRSTTSVEILENINIPELALDPADTLNCAATEINLQSLATGTSPAPALSYAWTSPDGNILSGADSASPLIDEPGTYELIVTDESNDCTVSDQLQVAQDVAAPIVNAGPGTELDCQTTSYTLTGSVNGTTDYDFQWNTVNGSIASDGNTLSPTVDAPGAYTLQVTDQNNFCVSSSSVTITANTSLPNIDISTGGQLDCANNTALIDASASDSGPNFVYSWSTTDGSFTGNADAPQITAEQAGTYSLQITNTDNNCVSNETITIEEDLQPPVAAAGADAVLNCNTPSLQLDGSGSSQGSIYSYEWSSGGSVVATGANPTISEPGTYQLLVTNTDNQCTDTDEVTVIIDTLSPAAAIAAAETITCTLTSITLEGGASSQGTDFSYSWSTQDGSIVSGASSLNPVIDAGGTYLLEVADNSNGCTQTATVLVPEDVDPPVAEAGQPVIINCFEPNPALDAGNSSQGVNFTYQWDGPGLLSGTNSTTPQIDQPGDYTITVTNTDNNCTATDIVSIQRDTVTPTVAISEPAVLDCERLQQEIDAGGSSSGTAFTYEWTTGDGNILDGADTPDPLIDEPGTYSLTILNTENGCSQTASVTVARDITPPVAQAADPEVVTCAVPSIVIDASSSSSGNDFTYAWSTNDGNITDGNSTLTPTVDQGGTYTLLITNTVNRCTEQIEVAVDQNTTLPVAEAGPAAIINCNNPSLLLDASASSQGGNFAYEWSGPGLIGGSTTVSPEVNEPGAYELLVTDTENGCTATDAVQIELDTLSPTVEIEEADILTCALTSQQLDATGSSQGADFVYSWAAAGSANIVSGADTPAPTVDAPGTYTLTVLNTDNGCSQTASLAVAQDITPPEIDIATPDTLTCVVEEIALDAGASSQGPEFSYAWTAIDGNITVGSNTISPTVDAGGVYELLITDTDNQCTSTLQIEVIQDVAVPTAEAGTPQELNCDAPTLTLSGDGSSTGDFSYSWDGPGVVQQGNSLNPMINQPGTYVLQVTNNFNGCFAIDQVNISQDTALPSVVLLDPGLLTCDVQSVTIDASNSSQGPTFVYSWSTDNGNIVSGQDGLNPVVDEPGQYTLNVVNTENECENSNQINIGQDIAEPIADAGAGFLLECWEENSSLDGTGSSAGPNFVYNWSTDNGNLLSGTTGLQPQIDEPGVYTLLVTNTSNGCTSADEVAITQSIPVSDVNIEQPPCFGDLGQLSFTNITGGTAPFVYSVDGGENYFPSPNFVNMQPGNYELVVQDINGCIHEIEAEIIEPDSLTVLITNEVEVDLNFGEEHQVQAAVNIPEEELANIQWTGGVDSTMSCTDCLRPLIRPLRTADYFLEVVTENGCTDKAKLRIYVNREKPIYVPNVFSPNGDGSNDRFYIFSRQGVVEEIQSFQVFNRWGETVFEVYGSQPNDPLSGWDGSFRGELMNGAVFTWYAEIEFIDGTVELFKGDVTLLR